MGKDSDLALARRASRALHHGRMKRTLSDRLRYLAPWSFLVKTLRIWLLILAAMAAHRTPWRQKRSTRRIRTGRVPGREETPLSMAQARLDAQDAEQKLAQNASHASSARNSHVSIPPAAIGSSTGSRQSPPDDQHEKAEEQLKEQEHAEAGSEFCRRSTSAIAAMPSR